MKLTVTTVEFYFRSATCRNLQKKSHLSVSLAVMMPASRRCRHVAGRLSCNRDGVRGRTELRRANQTVSVLVSSDGH